MTETCAAGQLPLSLCPEQIGTQDDGDVAGRHLINLAVLSQFRQELHEIPATQPSPFMCRILNFSILKLSENKSNMSLKS